MRCLEHNKHIPVARRQEVAGSVEEVVRLIETHSLAPESIPSRWLDAAEVWEALLVRMPFADLLRNLARMTATGVLAPRRPATALVTLRLTDVERIRRSRIHPVAVLSAIEAYRLCGQPHSNLEWTPVQEILDALDDAFYLSFANVRRTGRRIYIAIDADPSMPLSWPAAMAMSVARSETDPVVAAFKHGVWPVEIGAEDRLEIAMETLRRPSRQTFASSPVYDAMERSIPVDAFVIIAADHNHRFSEGLQQYRDLTGIPAKLAVISRLAARNALPERNEPGRLDICGFDEFVPAVLADFVLQS